MTKNKHYLSMEAYQVSQGWELIIKEKDEEDKPRRI